MRLRDAGIVFIIAALVACGGDSFFYSVAEDVIEDETGACLSRECCDEREVETDSTRVRCRWQPVKLTCECDTLRTE